MRQILAAQAAGEAEQKLRVIDDQNKTSEIVLAPALSRLLMELLRHVGKGDAVTLVPVSQMLTTQQAADILNVSRPFLISLLEKGEIEHTLVGRHRRIKAEHLFAYKSARDDKRARGAGGTGGTERGPALGHVREPLHGSCGCLRPRRGPETEPPA